MMVVVFLFPKSSHPSSKLLIEATLKLPGFGFLVSTPMTTKSHLLTIYGTLMLAIRFASAITAHSTLFTTTSLVTTFASTTKAFRSGPLRGIHHCNFRQPHNPLAVWSSNRQLFTPDHSSKLPFSNGSSNAIGGSHNTMANKRKNSASATASPRRSTRTRASKSDTTEKEPKEENRKDNVKGKAKQPKQEPLSSSSSSSYKMLMILSPAKTLNLEPQTEPLPVEWTQPLETLQAQRQQIVAAVQEHAQSTTKLGSLLKTSAKITATAQAYWKAISSDASQGQKPAIVTFDGFAYAGLNVRDTLVDSKSTLGYLQDHLRIVDPLYGWLRPMDAMEAYRLEMASKGVFSNDPKVKLHDYWKPGIEECLVQEEQQANNNNSLLVVNLASDEYSAAIDSNQRTMVKIVFRHGGRTIAVHAKRARGLMVRYAALHQIDTVDGLKTFDSEGYCYQPDQSTYDAMGGAQGVLQPDDAKSKRKKVEQPTLVFDRPGTWKKPK